MNEEAREHKRKRERDYYHKTRERRIELSRKRYKENKEKFFVWNKTSVLKRKYGLSWEEYEQLFEKQNGVCAICECTEEGRMLSVDHNHKTGEVRGLLCGSCNRAIGLLKDSPELLGRAKEYVS